MKSKTYLWWYILLGLVLGAGFYTIFRLYYYGHSSVFHIDDAIPWTLLVAAYVVFVLTSVGLTFVASLYFVFKIQRYKRIVKRALLLAIATLFAGFICLILELGTPVNMMYYVLSPNFNSPMWWMGAFYLIYLVFLITKFMTVHFGDWDSKSSYNIGLVLFFSAIAAFSTEGSVFGTVEARPTFFGDFMPAYFLLTAFLNGLATIIAFRFIYNKIVGGDIPEAGVKLFNELAKILGLIVGVTLLFSIWRTITGLYAIRPEYAAIKYMIKSVPFFIETGIGLLIPLIMMTNKKIRESETGKIIASVLVIIGIVIGRMDFIMIGQMQPLVPKYIGEHEFSLYIPTIWEWIICFFSLSVMIIIYLFGEAWLKLSSKPE